MSISNLRQYCMFLRTGTVYERLGQKELEGEWRYT